MIIRADVVERANIFLKEMWSGASEFTKTYALLDWTPQVDGLTYEEISIILFPEEILPNGAPRGRALRRAKGLVRKIRHNQLNDGLVPFAVTRRVNTFAQGSGTVVKSGYFVKNITNKAEWDKIAKRFNQTAEGIKNSVKKFQKVMDKPQSQRMKLVNKILQDMKSELNIEEIQIQNGNGKRKKKVEQ